MLFLGPRRRDRLAVEFVLPWDPKTVTEAAKTGCAITASAPKSGVSRAIVQASIALAAHEMEGARKKSMWRWMKGKN